MIEIMFLILLLLSTSYAQFCDNAVTKVVLDTSTGVKLPVYQGSAIVNVGANVLAIWSSPTQTFSQLSFNFGQTFPAFTKRVMLNSPTSIANMDLITDGKSIIAVGKQGSFIGNLEFSLSDLSWTNGSVVYNRIPFFTSCTAKTNLFICAISDIDPLQVFQEGVYILTLSTTITNSTEKHYVSQWIRRKAENEPLSQAKPGIATDGVSVMVCAVGQFGGIKLICTLSEDGIEEYLPVASEPTNDVLSVNTDVLIFSNGIYGTYIVAYVKSGVVETRLTQNLGASWTIGNTLFPGSGSLPSSLVFTEQFMAVLVQSSKALISIQNNTNPVQWTLPLELSPNASELSFTSGRFGRNYHFISKTGNQISVTSCIPTAAPTVAPSPSPTKSGLSLSSGSIRYFFLLFLLIWVF